MQSRKFGERDRASVAVFASMAHLRVRAINKSEAVHLLFFRSAELYYAAVGLTEPSIAVQAVWHINAQAPLIMYYTTARYSRVVRIEKGTSNK